MPEKDQDVWKYIESRFRPILVAFFLSRGVSLSDAEDLVQDVFVRVMRAELSTVENLEAFVFRIAKNILLDRYRRARTRNAFLSEIKALEGYDFDTLDPFRRLSAYERWQSLQHRLGELPERTRGLFLRSRLEGVSPLDLAKQEGISVRAVHKHVAKALAYLKATLGAEAQL